MSENPISTVLYVCAMAAAGLLVGLIYFRALRRTVELLAGGRGWFGPAALTIARIMGAIVVLIFIARLGATALLAGFTGFLAARAVAVRSAWRVG